MAEPSGLGLSFHFELEDELLGARRRFGHVELMAEHFLDRPQRWGAAKRLRSFLPVTVHGVGLSLGSAEGLDRAYLEKLWAFLDFVKPAWFSEHLAFTRAGGRELPHFAPLPRDAAALAALAANARTLRSGMACPLLVENPAFPIGPAGGWSEGEFCARACDAADAGLLLDLHNLHANAFNRGFDAAAELERMPLERVRQAHLAGGHRSGRWLIDCHTKPVPDPVYALLSRLRELGPDPAVTLEWDDGRPAFGEMLSTLARAEGRGSGLVQASAAQTPCASTGPLDLPRYQTEFVSAMLDGREGSLAGIPAEDLAAYAAGLRGKAAKGRSGSRAGAAA